MKNSNSQFGPMVLACFSGIFLFLLFVVATGCKKETIDPPIELDRINGRWAQVQDTGSHFYIDSLTGSVAVLRYPSLLNAPLTTYRRVEFRSIVTTDTVYLTAPAVPGKYTLFRVSGKWFGWVYLQNMAGQMERISIRQIDNDTCQPGPAPIPAL